MVSGAIFSSVQVLDVLTDLFPCFQFIANGDQQFAGVRVNMIIEWRYVYEHTPDFNENLACLAGKEVTCRPRARGFCGFIIFFVLYHINILIFDKVYM